MATDPYTREQQRQRQGILTRVSNQAKAGIGMARQGVGDFLEYLDNDLLSGVRPPRKVLEDAAAQRAATGWSPAEIEAYDTALSFPSPGVLYPSDPSGPARVDPRKRRGGAPMAASQSRPAAPWSMGPTEAANAGLTRVVRTASGGYTNAPGVEGEERYYDAMGNRADSSYQMPDVEGMTPAEFYAKQRTAPRVDDQTLVQRGERALGVRRRIDEQMDAAAQAAEMDRIMQLTKKVPKTPEEIAAAIAKTQSETALNAARAGKTTVDAARADLDAKLAEEAAAREAQQFDPLREHYDAAIAQLGPDPDAAAREFGFNNADEYAAVMGLQRAIRSDVPGGFDINKSPTAARAMSFLQRDLSSRINSDWSLNPFDKRRAWWDQAAKNNAMNLANMRLSPAGTEWGDAVYLEHGDPGTDDYRATLIDPNDESTPAWMRDLDMLEYLVGQNGGIRRISGRRP